MSQLIALIKSDAAIEDVNNNLLDNNEVTGYVDLKDFSGYSALAWAVLKDNFKIAEILLQNGANINTLNNNGDSILALAIKYGSHFMCDNLCLAIKDYFIKI